MLLAYIQSLIATHGLWIVFLIVMLESAGVPLPGETALVSAAIFAGASGGLEIWLVIPVAIAGAILGDNIGFWAGRRYGQRLIRRLGALAGLDARQLLLGYVLFRRHGAKIVFFGRFVAFLRMFAAPLAGAHGLDWRRFLMFNAAGAIVWATLFGLGGYLFGTVVARISGPLGVAALVVGLAVLWAFWRAAMRKERQYFARLQGQAPPDRSA